MSKKLYVGNLSFDTTEDSIIGAFEQDGRQVSSVSIITDRDTGRPRGFAFVEMANEADARAAIDALNETDLDGRTIRVNEAQERQDRGGSGGGGGGGGGGGRRQRSQGNF